MAVSCRLGYPEPITHPRKKGGERKDKKVERMKEDLAKRKAKAMPEHPTTDQGDIQSFKPGAADDKNREPRRPNK